MALLSLKWLGWLIAADLVVIFILSLLGRPIPSALEDALKILGGALAGYIGAAASFYWGAPPEQ